MTENEAKEILKLYRPGTADAEDPSFAEAIVLSERDGELKKWFAGHCALYSALRAKFKQIAVPEGLKEQIIAERKVRTTAAPLWQKAVVLVGAVAALALIVFEVQTNRKPSERHDFATYRGSVVGYAARGYGTMDLYTNDLNAIRQFLGEKGDVADYELPTNLTKNGKPAGCVSTLTWQGKKVSMICFQTGRPLKPGLPSDLWLFVTDRSSASGTPTDSKPVLKEGPEPGVATASWTVGNRTYILAVKGDKELLSRFL